MRITATRLFLSIGSGLIPNLCRRCLFRNGAASRTGLLRKPSQIITSIKNESPQEARLSCGKRTNKFVSGY
jgi:hypothetical protein